MAKYPYYRKAAFKQRMGGSPVRMDRSLKRWWLRALRGGNYEQGTDYLRSTENKCCCLGVLADGIGAEWGEQDGCGYYVTDLMMSDDRNLLSLEVLQSVGLTIDAQAELARLNDHGYTFKQIANIIAKNL